MTETVIAKGKGGHVDGPAEVIPRNIHFDEIKNLDMRDWHSGNPVLSQFFNGLSLMFPDGEEFFVHSVRNYAKDIEDPTLRKHVKGFMTQEAIHSREHEVYNDVLIEQGYPAKPLLEANRKGAEFQKKASKPVQLAMTCAAEHFTAILADMLLSDERFMGGVHPAMRELWQWHAIEETEHKGVAYDVYEATNAGFKGYLIRCLVMIFTVLTFPLGMVVNTLFMLKGSGDLFNMKAWGQALKWFWLSPAFMPRMYWRVLPYFKPNFHPWDEQNYHFVEQWNEKNQEVMAAE